MFTLSTRAAAAALLSSASVALPVAATPINLQVLGTYETGIYDEGAAEIVAFDKISKRLFVVNGDSDAIDILDLANPLAFGNASKIGQLVLDPAGNHSPNSVAVWNGSSNYVAVASDFTPLPQAPGQVSLFDPATGNLLAKAYVGSIPDMLTFTEVGGKLKLVVANEGEPNNAYTLDPEGSVALIDVADMIAGWNKSGGNNIGKATEDAVTTIRFQDFEDDKAALIAAGLRIFGPTTSLITNLEPEYIAVHGETAYVTLQENNAIAKINLATATVEAIKPLGFKDHSLPGNGLDVADDNIINISNYPVLGMYMPDAIAATTLKGKTILLTANEGDAREYDVFEEEESVGGANLDPSLAGLPAELMDLNITTATGDTDGDGDLDQLYSFGARSFSMWDENGNLVWDSGDFIERKVAEVAPAYFNVSNTNNSLDNRSDNKGPEPEAIVVGEAFGRTLVFVGLERQGGVMIFDITDFDPMAGTLPTADELFVAYINNRDFTKSPASLLAGDLGPEGLLFISAADSPSGNPLLVVANEISGTTTVYSIVPEPSVAALLTLPALALLRRPRR